MRVFKKSFSIFLVLAICLLSFPVLSVMVEATGAKKVICQFEPGKTGQTDGQYVLSWIQDTNNDFYTHVRKDADGYYYSTGVNANCGQRYVGFDTGWTSETMPMLANNTVMNALTPFIEVSLDVRVVSDNPSAFSNNKFTFDVASYESSIYWYYWGLEADTDGNWHTYTKTNDSNTYSGGIISKITYIFKNAPINCSVDVRNFKLSVNENDAAAINAALAGTGYTYESITSYVPYYYSDASQVIYQFDPGKTGQTVGDDLYINDGFSVYHTYVRKDDDGYYYSTEIDARTNPFHVCYDSGWRAETLPLLGNIDVMNRLGSFVEISLDVRVVSDSPGFSNNSLGIQVGSLDAIGGYYWYHYDVYAQTDGNWHTYSKTEMSHNYAGGFLNKITYYISSDIPVDCKVEVRNFKATVSAGDANEINAALDGTGYTYSDLVSYEPYYYLPQFSSHSLVLSGQIGVNFLMNLNALTPAEKAGSYMTFGINNSDATKVDAYDGSDINASGFYRFTCYVNSVQMAEDITPTFHYANGQTVTGEAYSVKDYVDYVAGHTNRFADDTVTLVKALGDYGHYAQIYLNNLHSQTFTTMPKYRASDYTLGDFTSRVSALDSIGTGVTHEKSVSGIDSGNVTFTLNFDSTTLLKVTVNSASAVSATVNGRPADIAKSGNNYYIVTPGLYITQLNQKYTVAGSNASGSFSIGNLSALSYIRAILNSGTDSNGRKSAMAAFYDYYAAAMVFAA